MSDCGPRLFSLGAYGLLLIGLCGCLSLDRAEEEKRDRGGTVPQEVGPDVESPKEAVRTVQLYRGTDERQLPVTTPNGAPPLTLEFDVLDEEGRPLSIYFVHADRTWRRDLMSSQSLDSYSSDRLTDYDPSRGTEVRYVHYTYRFPNDDIQFRVSGNFILRVTERGKRDSVLFERPFFVAEEEGTLRSGLEPLHQSGSSGPSVRPVARYDPPARLRGIPSDFAACFIRSGHLRDIRCQDRPLLANQPRLEFELGRSDAFASGPLDYTVNLGRLRAGSRIERTDRTKSPLQVLLEPDYASFTGGALDAALNGQIVVRGAVRNRANPSLTAEYVRTTFSLVPSRERPLDGRVSVAGSFTGMDPTRGYAMEWQSERNRYEADVLLKQGQYQYFYDGSGIQRDAERRRSQSSLRRDIFTAFVYYRDPALGTDRLLRVGQIE